jgi:16S rRNA processing protein RimM
LLVPQSDRPALGEDEYHVLDLIGLEVFNQLTSETFGTVVDVISAGNDLLEVQPHSLQPSITPAVADNTSTLTAGNHGRRKPRIKSSKPQTTVLIPFVKAIVPVVDLQAGRVEITPTPGLLEINEDSSTK